MNSKTIELDSERWSRVQSVFAQAIELEAKQRRVFVERACADDEELRDYVLDLLHADDSGADSVENAIANTVNLAFGDETAESGQVEGQMVGHYRIERLIGSGGMGMVYLAERADEQFDQKVAIKLGRQRLVDPQTELRLRNERQILANLDHPNIARLFDGGTTGDGVPYLVMEYIDGRPVDEYCDEQRLDTVARLNLFQTICAAVHYAHQNLVIHRDIKASNILVTDDGTPKLLDFGIAKLADAQGEAMAGLTREGAVILTPENAAPEQVQGKNVTTSTDVYALGLLLYDLLTGFRAYEPEGTTPSDFARVICLEDIPRPSVRLQRELHAAISDNESERMLGRISHDRKTTSERLQRRLRGDLDTIVLNALRKEPERRYRSAAALADDIALHQKSMPIVARADSWRYRASKFVRRHYAAVSVAVLVVAILAVFTVLLSIQNRQVVRERDTAREVSQFLEDSFNAADPAQARGVDVTAEEILAVGADRIRNDLADRPEIQAALMGTIGRVYYGLGDYQSSFDMLETALELRRRVDGADHPNVAAAENDLAVTLISRTDYEQAESLLEHALRTNTENEGATSVSVAQNLKNLAELHLITGELTEAESLAESSIAIYELTEGHGDELAAAKALLARILQVRGDLDKTEGLLLDAIEIVRTSEGENHPSIAYYLQNLGVLQRSKGDFDAAELTLERAIEATRRILGDKHDLLAATHAELGLVLHAKGDYENAERVMREALSLYSEMRGPDNPFVGYTLTILGMLLHDKSDLSEAESTLRRALTVFEQALGEEHQYTASALTELGAVLNSTDRSVEARTLLGRAMGIREKDYPPDHELVAATRTEYADALLRLGRHAEAESLLRQSLSVLQDKPGRRQQRVRAVLARLRVLSATPN